MGVVAGCGCETFYFVDSELKILLMSCLNWTIENLDFAC